LSPATVAAGGILLCAFVGALSNQHYSWIALGCAALGSWLPHMSKRPQLMTHSLLGLTGWALIASPLLLWHRAAFWTALLIGYASHLLLDAGSDSGVRLFYPARVLAVLPRHPLSRIQPGTPRERLLRRWLVGLWLVAIPLNAMGLRGLLHQLLPVIQFAVEDYETTGAQGRRVFADFTGRFSASQRPITGRWEVLETLDRTTLLIEDSEGRRYTLGTHPHDTIQVLRVRARKGPPVDVRLQTVHLHEQLLVDLMPLIPSEGRTYLIGGVKSPERIPPHLAVEEFQTVQGGSGQITLRYATVQDLRDQHLLGLYITDGEVVLRTLRVTGSHPPARGDTPMPQPRVAPRRAITLVVRHFSDPQELLVHDGQEVTVGQPLADLRSYRRELQENVRLAQTEATAAGLRVLSVELQQAQQRSLKGTEDVLIGTHRDLIAWKAAQAQVLSHVEAQAAASQAKLAGFQRALAATTILAPAGGRFLSMEFHPSTSTATLHLLADE